MRVHHALVGVSFYDLDLLQSLVEGEFVAVLYAFADEFERIAVGNGKVVVVLMYVIPEDFAGKFPLSGLSDEGGSGKRDHYGVPVRFHEARQKTSVRIVASMGLVKKIDPLDVQVVIVGPEDVRVVLEFLYVDDRDFPCSRKVVYRLLSAEFPHELVLRIDRMDDQSTARKFPLGLYHEIEAVHDEVKARNNPLILEKIGKVAGIVVSEGGLAAALRMPNDAFLDSRGYFPFDSLGGEKLRVPHDVLFNAGRSFHVRDAIFQQRREPVRRKQRGQYPVRGRVGILVNGEFGRMLNGLEIIVG